MGSSTDLAAVKIHKPNVIWHFEIRLVEEETGWYTYNVWSGSKKELRRENNMPVSQHSDGSLNDLKLTLDTCSDIDLIFKFGPDVF